MTRFIAGLALALALGALAEMPEPHKDSGCPDSTCRAGWNGKPSADPVVP